MGETLEPLRWLKVEGPKKISLDYINFITHLRKTFFGNCYHGKDILVQNPM